MCFKFNGPVASKTAHDAERLPAVSDQTRQAGGRGGVAAVLSLPAFKAPWWQAGIPLERSGSGICCCVSYLGPVAQSQFGLRLPACRRHFGRQERFV